MKAQIDEVIGEAIKPGTLSLFKIIQRLLQFTQMMRESIVNKPLWLCHVDILLKNVMQEGISDIKLMKRAAKMHY